MGFADIPHLLKLLRNNFLDHGIAFPNGETVQKSDIASIIETEE